MFTTINQYLGRLYQRWGQTSKEMTGIQIHVAQISNPRKRDQFTKCPIVSIRYISHTRKLRLKLSENRVQNISMSQKNKNVTYFEIV